MSRYNRFDALLDSLTETRDATEGIREKITDGAIELNKAKKIYFIKERILTEGKAEVAELKKSNRELKVNMVLSLIERDELEAKKKDLQQKLQKIKQDINEFDNQSDYVLDSVERSRPQTQSNSKS